MQVKDGICKICSKPSRVKSKVCQPCATKRFRSYGQPKKDKKQKKEPSGEAELFRIIWNERPHICESCGKPLGNQANATFFSHIIRKGQRQDLMLEPDNILLECFKCHFNWDHGIMINKMKQLSFNKKLEYIKNNDNKIYQQLLTLINENQEKTNQAKAD